MASYSSSLNTSWQRPPVTDAVYVSPEYLSGLDPLYSPFASLQAIPREGGLLTRKSRTAATHLRPSYFNRSWAGNFYYRYRYFNQGEEFLENLSLGTLLQAREVEVNVFNGFKGTAIVTGISVTAGQGVTVTSPVVNDRIMPYASYPLELSIEKEGVSVGEADIEITFDSGRVWSFSVGFIRLAVPLSLLDANWAEEVSLSTSYLTSVFTAATGAQTRKILRNKPVRRQTVSMTFSDKESSLRAWSAARDVLSSAFYFPIYPDVSVMQGSQVGTKILCDTAYRRFEVGQFVLLRHLNAPGDASGDILGSQVFEVSLVEPDGVTLIAPDLEAYTAGDIVYPMQKCMPNAGSTSLSCFTDRKGRLNVETTAELGEASIGLENPTYSPEVRAGYPILDFDINEIKDTEILLMQAGTTAESGRGFEVTRYGEAFQTQSVNILAENREKYWDILGFFHKIKGRANIFWIKQYQDMLTLTGQVGDTYSFASDLNTEDLFGLVYLWVEDSAGNKDVVNIIGALNTAAGFDLLCSTSALVSNANYAVQALPVRQSDDILVERWLTNTSVEISFTVEEVQGIYTT